MIPPFNEKGLLPSGIYPATLEEIRKRFGSANRRRKELFLGLKSALKNLKEAGVIKVYINGSFVTREPEPKDIDGGWVPVELINLDVLDPVFLDFSSGRKRMKEKYGVDFFIANHVEGGSGYPFIDFFQISRDGDPKGIIFIDLGGEFND